LLSEQRSDEHPRAAYDSWIHGIRAAVQVQVRQHLRSSTNKLFLDPCVNMSPRAVLTDVCPEDCNSGGAGFFQQATGQRLGNCGCNDPFGCGKNEPYPASISSGMSGFAPRFQTIMNHTYAPFCNRFCTKTFEQDQWRDHLFTKEKDSLDGWRFCYKSKPWERPERTKLWDGDHGEFRRTQTTILPPILKDDIDIGLKGCGCGPSGRSQPATCMPFNREDGNSYPPKNLTPGCCKNATKSSYCATAQMKPKRGHVLEGVLEALGEPPILTLHKIQQKLEDSSGKFYPEERGLARVCNPVNYSYLTARPFRCNPIYRVCEPVHSTFAGHVPGEIFIPGENRSIATRNALKYMTYRV